MSANGTSLKSDVVEFIACLAGDQVPAAQNRAGALRRAGHVHLDGRPGMLPGSGSGGEDRGGGADRGGFLDQLQVGREKRFTAHLGSLARRQRGEDARGRRVGSIFRSSRRHQARGGSDLRSAAGRYVRSSSHFAAPASRTADRSQPLPSTELEWQLRKSAELEQLKQKLGVHSPEAASLDTPWAAMVRERAQANIELCQSGFSEEEEEQEEELEPPDDFPEPPDDGLEPPEEEQQGEQGEQQ